MPAPSRHPLFAVCTPGLEPLLAHELGALGVRHPHLRNGGVSFDGTTRQLYAANVESRIATRIVRRVARFTARTFAELEAELGRTDWQPWLAPDALVEVRASSTASRLYHTGAIVERAERSVAARPDATDAPADPGSTQRVILRVVHDEVTVSIDTSGDALHRRGWRLQTAKAPLRETLAAAMLLAAGWEGVGPLVDPFCGAGTILIEGALLARRVPPGFGRSFAFSTWPSFEPGTWASVAGAAAAPVRTRQEPRPDAGAIVGRDRDAGAIQATEANAERAGVREDLDLARASLSELEPPPASSPGWILTNPPYGARVQGGNDLRDLYARFGDVLRTRFAGWSVGMLVADAALAGHTRLALEQRWRSSNGGIHVSFVTATV